MGFILGILKELFKRKPSPEEMVVFKRNRAKHTAEAILSEKWVWQDDETFYEGEPDVRVNRKGVQSVRGKWSPIASLTIGIFEVKPGVISNLEAEYQQALELDPNNAGLHNNMGFILYKGSKLEESEGEYKIALKLDSSNAELHNNFGAFLCEADRFVEAELEFKEAIWLDPNKCQFRKNLGRVLFLQAKFEEAEKEYLGVLTFTDHDYVTAGCEEILKEIRQRL